MTMSYLLEIIGARIKLAFELENAVGVSLIMDVPDIQDFINAVSLVYG